VALVSVVDSSIYAIGRRLAIVNMAGSGEDPVTGTVTGYQDSTHLYMQLDRAVNVSGSFSTLAYPLGGGAPIPAQLSDSAKLYLLDANLTLLDDTTGLTPPAAHIGVMVEEVSGINLSSGEWEELAAPLLAYTLYPGSIPCLMRRYYNSGTPESVKRTIQFWTTLKSATNTALTARTVEDYDEENDLPSTVLQVPLQQDPKGSSTTGSIRYLAQAPPSILIPAIGVDVFECGNAQLRVYDFTIKQTKA